MKKAETCPLSHSYAALSYTTAVFCVILFISTSLLNTLIVYIIQRDRPKKFRILFYKFLLNIAISDALVGYIADTFYVVIHILEAKNTGLKNREIIVGHMIMFILGGISLVTMVYLCIDRIYAILRPHSYRKGVSSIVARLLVASTWAISIFLALVYLAFGFIKYLVIFSLFNIAVPFIVLVITATVYHKKLVRDNITNENADCSMETSTLKRNENHIKKGRKATKSFLKMLLVFIFSYLPASFITIYFNLCSECGCLLVNALRDISVLCILSGSLLRAINFLLSLKSLRKEVSGILSRNFADHSLTESGEN